MKTDTAGLKAEQLFDSVCLSRGSLCLGVGVRDRCAADVSAEYLQDGCCKGGRGLPPIEQKRQGFIQFAPSGAASHIGCDTLWPRLASTMLAVITRRTTASRLTCLMQPA